MLEATFLSEANRAKMLEATFLSEASRQILLIKYYIKSFYEITLYNIVLYLSSKK